MVEIKGKYGVIKATPVFLVRDLLKVHHKDRELIVGYPAFGPNTYSENLTQMQSRYCHSEEQLDIRFREPTISQSVSVCVYEFGKRTKPEESDFFQLGKIIRTSEGFFANPPRNSNGKPIVDEKLLKSNLKGVKKVNGIYLAENDFGFAPYESFETGLQDCDTFARGGLARLLEHTQQKVAEGFRGIASPKIYPNGVHVKAFSATPEPLLRVVSLDSGRGIIFGWLNVYGDCRIDDGRGYAFGVLK